MARHIDPDDDSFRRSLLRAAGIGLLAMVATAVLAGVLTQLGRTDRAGSPAVSLEGSPSPAAGASPDAPAPEAPATEFALPTEQATEGTDAPTEVTGGKSPAEITVQVLDGRGDGVAVEEVAEVLRGLGYNVVAVNPAARDYVVTTVLVSDGRDDEAQGLAERDDRFTEVGENTNLNPDVDLHVVVGADWTGGD